MKVITSKSKNSESVYITKNELLKEHGPTRDDAIAWACEEAKKENQKYKEKQQNKAVQITFHADRQIPYYRRYFTVEYICFYRLSIIGFILIKFVKS